MKSRGWFFLACLAYGLGFRSAGARYIERARVARLARSYEEEVFGMTREALEQHFYAALERAKGRASKPADPSKAAVDKSVEGVDKS